MFKRVASAVDRLLHRGADAPGFAEAPPRFAPGAEAVSSGEDDAALLARLLALATRSPDPTPLATGVVRQFGSFPAVLAASPRDLFAIRGLGTHSVAAIKLVHEAALRVSRAGAAQAPALDAWPAVIAYLTAVLAREPVEHFRILFLDRAGVLLADEAQSRGTVNHTPVYPREVARRALELAAASLILVHNHPSGDPTPSAPDLDMTERICAAVGLFGVSVVDHVIIGNGRWTSFREAGLLGDG